MAIMMVLKNTKMVKNILVPPLLELSFAELGVFTFAWPSSMPLCADTRKMQNTSRRKNVKETGFLCIAFLKEEKERNRNRG